MSSLNRIVGAQEEHPGYEIALEEMKTGRKHSDWIWYIFPQMKGMGMGYDAEFYGIQSLFEARHYMEYEHLGDRLQEITKAVLRHDTTSIEDIMRSEEDTSVFHASMTLFDIICPGCCFNRALDVYFDGERDKKTLTLVEQEREYLYGDSAFVQSGISGYSERGYFEGGVVESDEIPTEIKLPTVLGFVLEGHSMKDMIHHYLFHKDFSHYRLSGVLSRLEWYRNTLLNQLAKNTHPNGVVVLKRVFQRLERLEDCKHSELLPEVEDAANAFDFVVFECSKEQELKEKMVSIAASAKKKDSRC